MKNGVNLDIVKVSHDQPPQFTHQEVTDQSGQQIWAMGKR